MQTKHTLTCDVCQQVIEGSSERGVRQGLGVHKRAAHSVVGSGKAYTTRADRVKQALLGRPMDRVEAMQLSPEEKKMRQKLQRKAWWERRRNGAPPFVHAQQPTEPVVQTPQAQPCKLSECPCCGARFYVAKGQIE